MKSVKLCKNMLVKIDMDTSKTARNLYSFQTIWVFAAEAVG
jgi:hypothetical protein